jgi:hypothetical protein
VEVFLTWAADVRRNWIELQRTQARFGSRTARWCCSNPAPSRANSVGPVHQPSPKVPTILTGSEVWQPGLWRRWRMPLGEVATWRRQGFVSRWSRWPKRRVDAAGIPCRSLRRRCKRRLGELARREATVNVGIAGYHPATAPRGRDEHAEDEKHSVRLTREWSAGDHSHQGRHGRCSPA